MTTKSEFDILSVQSIASETNLSTRVVLDAFRSGELKGRNHKGRKGWTATRGALREWIDGGNQGDSNGHTDEDDAAFGE